MDRPCRWAVPCRHLRTWLPRTSSPTPPKQVIPVIPSRIDFLDHEKHIKKQQIHQRWRSGPTRQSGFCTRPAGDLMNHLSGGEHQHLVDIISTDPSIFQNFSQRSSVVKAKIHGHYHPQVPSHGFKDSPVLKLHGTPWPGGLGGEVLWKRLHLPWEMGTRGGPVADPWRDVMIGDGYGFEILQNAAICWQDTLWLFDTMENPKIHHW